MSLAAAARPPPHPPGPTQSSSFLTTSHSPHPKLSPPSLTPSPHTPHLVDGCQCRVHQLGLLPQQRPVLAQALNSLGHVSRRLLLIQAVLTQLNNRLVQRRVTPGGAHLGGGSRSSGWVGGQGGDTGARWKEVHNVQEAVLHTGH